MDRKKSVYDFAVERSSGKPLDRLTICSLAAQAEGLSYGKYMVKYNYHPPCLEERPAENKPRPKKTAYEHTDPDTLVKLTESVCPQCGKVFYHGGHSQTYCSNECQKEHSRITAVAKYREKHGLEGDRHCLICGRRFSENDHKSRKTCPGECAVIYRRNQNREKNARYLAKKKEKRKE